MEEIKAFFKNPRNAIAVGICLLLLAVGLLFLFGVFGPSEETVQRDQIQIKRGDKIVTVNENGLVEYRSDQGVFYETWDPNKTSAFFSTIREQARAYLADPPKSRPENAYEVTLWIDGELVTIYIDADDEVINEVFEEFDDTGGGGNGDLSDYFDIEDEEGFPTPTLPFGVSATPTLAPGVNPTATPVPNSTGQGGSGQQSAVDCDLYNTQVTKRTVISNTICQTESP